jgi:hypothetical protein
MWDFRFSRLRAWSSESSGMKHRVVTLKLTDVSEVRTASIIRTTHRRVDGSSTYLWNVGQLQREYKTLHPRILKTSISFTFHICIHTSAVFPITHSVMYGPAFRATYSDIHVLTYPFGKCKAFLFKIVFMGMCQLHTNGSFCVEQRVAYCNVLGVLYSRWNFIALQKSVHYS